MTQVPDDGLAELHWLGMVSCASFAGCAAVGVLKLLTDSDSGTGPERQQFKFNFQLERPISASASVLGAFKLLVLVPVERPASGPLCAPIADMPARATVLLTQWQAQ